MMEKNEPRIKRSIAEFLPILTNVIPVCTAVGLAAAIGLVDVHLAGNLGATVQAGVGIGDQALFFAALMGTGIAQACGSLIARASGAGAINEAKIFASTGLRLAIFLGSSASIITIACAEPFLALFSNDETVRQAGALYLKLCSIANVPYCLLLTQSALLRATGKSFSTVFPWLVAAAISIALSISLTELMPHGRKYTIEYIALAWNAGAFIGLGFGHAELRKMGFHIFNSDLNFQKFLDCAKQILSLGLPIALTEAAWLGSNFFIYLILAEMPCASDAQAAWTIRLKIEEIVATPFILAASMTAASLVGQLVGAARPAEALETANKAALIAVLLLLFIGIFVGINSEILAVLHATAPESAKQAELLMSASLLIYPLSAFYITVFGALEGAGSTVKPMIAVVLGLFVLRIPLSAVLALYLNMGMTGIVIAMTISHLAVALSAVSQLRTFFTEGTILEEPQTCAINSGGSGYILHKRQQETKFERVPERRAKF